MENNQNNRQAMINAMKNRFISTVIKIYVNSLDREVNFREITVDEQKKLSRIMIDNENRKDIVYDAQCAILKSICLEQDFDVYKLSEFDKIKLLMMLYQRNMMKHDVTFTCPECHSQNKYKLDFSNVIHRLDQFDISDRDFNYENDNWKFVFRLGYPSVKDVSGFYQQRYSKMGRITDAKALESINNSINIDYINLFVKSVEFSDKATGTTDKIGRDTNTLGEMFDVMSVFPQDVMYSEKGAITFITQEFITKINEAFEKHECTVCRHLCENTVDSDVQGFF